MEAAYRKSLVDAINYLIGARHRLFDHAFDVAMNNALKEINNVFDVGDTYRFELVHFDNSGDPNLQKLVDLIRMIEMTVDSITNVNKIDPSELDHE